MDYDAWAKSKMLIEPKPFMLVLTMDYCMHSMVKLDGVEQWAFVPPFISSIFSFNG